MNSKKITNGLLYFACIVLIFSAGYKTAQWQISKGAIQQDNFTILNAKNKNSNEIIDFSLFWDTWNKIEQKYIDKEKLNTKQMYYGAIKGMVASLGDPYTFFLTPDENKQSKDDLGGKLEGIGAQLGLKESRIVVIAPMKDSPAQKAGIKEGDIILTVDGKQVRNWSLAQTVSKIRGPKGTKVTLTVARNNEEKKFTITRERIQVPSIELSYEKTESNQNVAHIKINMFGDTTNDEWDKTVAEVANRIDANTIKGIVLDLRNNPGGYLESAVYIASEFLDIGQTVVRQETSIGQDRSYVVERTGKLQSVPLVVLINGGSASAAEILSGALRDHKKARLIGEKSFGKGSVQEPIDLEGGAGLHVTIAKWILPKGDWINGKGIEPEIKVTNEVKDGNTLTKDADKQLQRAVQEVVKL